MKKFAAVLLLALFLALIFAQTALAVVTTEAQASTTATTYEGYDEGMVRGQDISAPIMACFIIVGACIIYGIYELRKHKNDTL